MNKSLLTFLLATSTTLMTGCSAVQISDTTSQSEANIAEWVNQTILASEGIALNSEDIRYLTGSADLNQDGLTEHFVLMQDRYFCGSGGCSAFIFDHSGKVLAQLSVTKPPIVLADSFNNGWQDFIVWSNGAYRLMSFNGESYPTNPSLEPSYNLASEQQTALSYVMSTELYQQDGYDLTPSEPNKIWAPAKQYWFTFKHYGDPDVVYHAQVDLTSGNVDISTSPVSKN